jgi:23S rRNA U2552 (ribose-2'-O)-methylase RlmE/FtsJ
MRYDLYQSTLAHLVKMASTNGWKAHAWYRAKELEQHHLGIFKGISQELTENNESKK